jgi:hypothetical protein
MNGSSAAVILPWFPSPCHNRPHSEHWPPQERCHTQPAPRAIRQARVGDVHAALYHVGEAPARAAQAPLGDPHDGVSNAARASNEPASRAAAPRPHCHHRSRARTLARRQAARPGPTELHHGSGNRPWTPSSRVTRSKGRRDWQCRSTHLRVDLSPGSIQCEARAGRSRISGIMNGGLLSLRRRTVALGVGVKNGGPMPGIITTARMVRRPRGNVPSPRGRASDEKTT